jgi:acetyltransferase-like isoleucine patch superfamily enzyme
MNDYLEFVYDSYVRSHENKELLYNYSNLSEANKYIIANEYSQRSGKLWESVYGKYVTHLKDRVMIKVSGKLSEVDTVQFHQKYGWIVFSGEIPAFLGKVEIENDLEIIVGQRSYVSGNATLRGNGLLRIGSYCGIGWGFFAFVDNESHPIEYPCNLNWSCDIRLNDYGLRLDLPNFTEQKDNFISIGSDVFIGRQVNIMNGVTIGDGCVIGANSMVTKNCIPYGIYAGTPAKLLRMRFSDSIINQLLSIRWWNWSKQMIMKNSRFFGTNLYEFTGDLNDIITVLNEQGQ